jgi:hypothetical protein
VIFGDAPPATLSSKFCNTLINRIASTLSLLSILFKAVNALKAKHRGGSEQPAQPSRRNANSSRPRSYKFRQQAEPRTARRFLGPKTTAVASAFRS